MAAPAAQLPSSPPRIMADPGGTDAKRLSSSPYHASPGAGTESLPNLASPGLSSVSDPPEASPRPPALASGWPPRKISGFQHVQAAPHASIQLPTCTHTTMTRQFDTQKDQTCDICHRKPFLGWLYVCTEDHGGFLPGDDDRSSSSGGYQPGDSGPTDRSSLSPWITKAIERGHYSEKEIELLKLQKAGVCDAVAATRNPTPASTLSRLSDFSDLHGADDEVWTETVEDIHATNGDPDVEDNNTDLAALPNPPCRLKCCHSCRPASRERSWASLNEICSEASVQPPPAWDAMNRRVSDVNIVRKLGQFNVSRKPSEAPCPFKEDNEVSAFDEKTRAAPTQTGDMERHSMESQSSQKHGGASLEKRNGSSGTEKDTEASATRHDSSCEPTQGLAPKSHAPSPTQRGGIFLTKRKNRSLWAPPAHQHRTGSETMLQKAPGSTHATNTQRQPPLAEQHDQCHDTKSEQDEVGVRGGVALTEEGVTSGTRDIIMNP